MLDPVITATPPAAFGLIWRDLGQKGTSHGPRRLYEARSTTAFDAAWTGGRRGELREMGFGTKRGDHGWMAQYWARPSAADEAEQAAAAAQAVEASRATDAAVEVPAPEGRTYLPYQRAGIAYAMQRPASLIGDEMGLGKTIQAIGVLNCGHAKRVLIACPASLKLNWRRELAAWMVDQLPVHVVSGGKGAFPDVRDGGVVIVTYDVMHSYTDAVRAVSWDLFVADEAHLLKSKKARRTRSVLGGGETKTAPAMTPISARRKLLLTGTPMPNRPAELHPLLAFLDRETWGEFFPYAKRYCNARQTRWGWDFDGSSHLDELQERLRPSVMVRRLKDDVLAELPPKVRQVIPIEAETAALRNLLRDEQAAADAWEDLKAKGGASLAAAFAEISRLRREVGIAKAPFVAEHALRDNGPLVLFAHHREVVDLLAAAMREAGRKVVIITGDTGTDERQANVDAFQGGHADVILGTLGAMGVGLTLTRSSHVVIGELDWSPDRILQAEDRCHRIGQQGSVHVEHIVFDGSLDARLVETLENKKTVQHAGLDALPVPVIQDTVEAPATAPTLEEVAPAAPDEEALREIEAEAAAPRVPEWQVRQAAAEAERARLRAVDEAYRERLRDAVALDGSLLRPDRLQRAEELLELEEWTGTSSLHARDLIYACAAAGEAEAAAAALRAIEAEAAARAERKAAAEREAEARRAARDATDAEVRGRLRDALDAAGWGLDADDHATATRLAEAATWAYGDRTVAQVFVDRLRGYVDRAAERVGAAEVPPEHLVLAADPDVRAAVLQACRRLSSLDADRASVENEVGWSKTTSWTGHWLAGQETLDEQAAAVAIGLLRIHHGQVDDALVDRLFGTSLDHLRKPRRVKAVEPVPAPFEVPLPLDSEPLDAVPVVEVPAVVAAPEVEPEAQVVEEPEPVDEVAPARPVARAVRVEPAENVAARARLTAVGEVLYGPRWQTDLARDLGVNDRTVRRYDSGATPIPVTLWADISAVARRRRLAIDGVIARLDVSVTLDRTPETTPYDEAAYQVWLAAEKARILAKAAMLGDLQPFQIVMQIETLEDKVASLRDRLARYESV